MTNPQLALAFFSQLAVIVLAAQLAGFVAKKYLGQPAVVGEMIAGIVLGPTLLGQFFPGFQELLFPKEARGLLFVGGQFGVGLYMFIVGLGFRTDEFSHNAGKASAVSIAGMAVPFILAAILAPYLHSVPGLFSPKAEIWQIALFTGACIAITAFPMLARIIHERGITGTPLGTLALSAGAFDDAAAWTVLAIVLATFGAGPIVAVKAIGGGIAFALFMTLIGKRLLANLARWHEKEGEITAPILGVVMALFLSCAFAMEFAGIHAVFGGFFLGVVMPRGAFGEAIRKKLEPFTLVVLLPMFFTFSGLNTELKTILEPGLLLAAVLLIGASILGKLGACWAAARLVGFDNRTALGVGSLMNARGLMELIILNIGLEKGVIEPGLFAILVLMAILTTLMATPLFQAVYGTPEQAKAAAEKLEA